MGFLCLKGKKGFTYIDYRSDIHVTHHILFFGHEPLVVDLSALLCVKTRLIQQDATFLACAHFIYEAVTHSQLLYHAATTLKLCVKIARLGLISCNHLNL